MTITPEELAAFADGQLEGDALARIAAAVEADPKLAEQVAAHRALADKLSSHFAPVLDQPVPDRLTSLLTDAKNSGADSPTPVIDFAAAKERILAKRRLPGWGWSGGAIAAALVAAIVLSTSDRTQSGVYADTQLASVLDTQLVADQPAGADTRILLSFRNEAGEFCRAYSLSDSSGIACRDNTGWRHEAIGEGSATKRSEFRMAGSENEILAAAQEMATEGAMSADDEAAAAANNWSE